MVFISPCEILAIAGVSGNPSELFARAATGLVRFVQKLGTSKLQWFIMVHHGSSFLLFEDHHFWGMPWSVCHGITNFCQNHVWFRFHLAVVSLKPGALHVRPGSKHRCDPQNSCRSGCQQSCAESESVHHSSQFSTQIRHLENTLMLLYVVVVFRYAMDIYGHRIPYRNLFFQPVTRPGLMHGASAEHSCSSPSSRCQCQVAPGKSADVEMGGEASHFGWSKFSRLTSI